MTFTSLTDKQKKQIQNHKEKHGARSANVFKAHLMRGKSKKESEKLAVERTPNLPPRRERRKKVKVEVDVEGEEAHTISSQGKRGRKKKVKEPEPEPEPEVETDDEETEETEEEE